ncbi:4-diphosphocytidyl-2-C-methyl-D-erythritol kinase [hydrothermal vent metagenome]|uniref:4-(cytidine 5'-diphospho)-2-C-methyl-D-erythritol kinase n=1 Tax=hydrothermal vent metagenome TaxID=652676 RepID=A0A3B0T3Q2_9ZZZZ
MAKNNITRLARAKINLDLLITGRREDGYHLLDSLVVFADIGDQISVRPSDKLSLNISGPFAPALSGEQDNIILRAARGLRDKFNIQQAAEIDLVKNLPVSSGIGGGSADAAAVMMALMALWQLSDKETELNDLALSLGADVPVCLASKTMQMSGVGEILRPVTINFPMFLLLVNPGVSLSTAEIFKTRAKREVDFSQSRTLPDTITNLTELTDIIGESGNDLEYDACAARPEIRKLLAHIKQVDDCIFTGMSGSGATCFGIFPAYGAAKAAANDIFRHFPHWWACPVQVR